MSEITIPEAYGPEPGWTYVPMPRSFGKGKSFVSGETDSDRVTIYYYLRESDGTLCAKFSVGYGAEGPPGYAHGGCMAAILDEGMGFVGWVAGHPIIAASITINFLRKLPLEKVLHLEARIDAIADNKVTTLGKLYDPETGNCFADGQGLFIEQPIEFFGELAGVRGIGRN
jgi:acyl-coenzyme A thioesterase PaaI-like protein